MFTETTLSNMQDKHDTIVKKQKKRNRNKVCSTSNAVLKWSTLSSTTVLMRLPSMNSVEKATLQTCRNCLMEDLDLTTSFLAQLNYDGIITEDQKDRVQKQTTRQDKIVMLLDILPRRGPRAFALFVKMLKTDYTWISEKLMAEQQVQKYTQKIKAAIDERTQENGEFMRDKDYMNKIITETIIPILMEEINSLSPSGMAKSCVDDALYDIITNNILPLIKKTGDKTKQKHLSCDALLNKIVDLLEELEKRCYKSLEIERNAEFTAQLPIPELIVKRIADVQTDLVVMKKEAKKFKRTEDKLTTENAKIKADTKAMKEEIKRLKADLQCNKSEVKKLKDELKKSKTENQRSKVEIKSLKDHLEQAGIDLRISSDFTQGCFDDS